MAPRNVPLIERKADARLLADQIKAHKTDCEHCRSWAMRGTCAREKEMRAELKAIREEIAHWHDPAPDDPVLF